MSMPIETIIDPPYGPDDETLADSGFYWREHEGIKLLVDRQLEKAGFVNAFSTRVGGVSPFPSNDLNLSGFDEDADENILENRRRFLMAIGSDHRLTTVWQVHGDHIKRVVDDADIANTEERADAIVSDRETVLVGVKTADCVPVLIGDPVTGAFAAVHAGWRGTVRSIVRKAVEALAETYEADPADLIAAIGPAACGRNYEVGQEVIDEFLQEVPDSRPYFTATRAGHALIDLHRANRDQLVSAGVAPVNIATAPFCTMERTDLFFSYRREKRKFGKTGRLLSVIGRAN